MEKKEILIRSLKRNKWFNFNSSHTFYLHISKLRKYCLINKRQRGVVKKYGLSRHQYKRLVNHGSISGEKLALW